MHGGRPAGRILLAVALLALPLVGIVLLAVGGATAAPGHRDAVLRIAPGQASDAQAVRSRSDPEPLARAATGDRDVGLLAVLLGAAALAVAGCSAAPPLRAAPLRAGGGVPAAGRGPPLLLPR